MLSIWVFWFANLNTVKNLNAGSQDPSQLRLRVTSGYLGSG